MAGSIYIPLVSVFDAKGIRQAQTSMQGLTGVLKNLKTTAGLAAASFATVGVGKFIKDSVAAARDLDRNLVGLNGVFEGMTPTMQQFTKDAKDIGLSQVEAARASTFLGSVLKQSGFDMGTVAGETKNLVGLASDLAATYGYDVSEALTGMTALFRGEYDPIEKFGVAMKQAEVNALLLERGQNKLTGAALRNAQAQARLDLLYQRSADAQGAYAKQSGNLFTTQKNLAASFKNLQSQVGSAMQEPLAKLLDSLTPLVESMGVKLVPIFEVFSKVVQVFTPVIQPLTDKFLFLVDALMPIVDVLIELIKPLMVPLVAIIKLLVTVLQPLIPIITFIAKLFGAILTPVLTVLSLALTIVIKLVEGLVNALLSIPFIGDLFKGANKALDEVITGFNGLNDQMLAVESNGKGMTDVLSKKIPSNAIDDIKGSAKAATKEVKATTTAIDELIDNARSIQKDLISAFDLSAIMRENKDTITESATYVAGKFQVVATGVVKGTTNIANSFRQNLSKLREFSRNLNGLIKQNLDIELIQQIVSAGPEAGNATAEAILASGQEGVSSLNKTFTSIRKVSGDIATKVAKRMQKVGDRIGNGLIDGLVSQRQALLNAVGDLGTDAADTFNKNIKSGLLNLANIAQDVRQPFIASQIAGLPAGKTVANTSSAITKNLNLIPVSQLRNPFDPKTNAVGAARFSEFKQRATAYNISINVAPGASGSQIGRAVIDAIQEYERINGKTWRKD